MKNGVEVRKNGSVITRREVFGYDVVAKDGTPHSGNPWDYLRNARWVADGNRFGIRKTYLHKYVGKE